MRSFTEYELLRIERRDRTTRKSVEVRLGTLHTGATEADLAEFWSRAIYAMRKYGLDEDERRDIAHELQREGVPLPNSSEWPGLSGRGGVWIDVATELAALVGA